MGPAEIKRPAARWQLMRSKTLGHNGKAVVQGRRLGAFSRNHDQAKGGTMSQRAPHTRRSDAALATLAAGGLLVFVAGFFGLGVAGYLNYTEEPPDAGPASTTAAVTLFTGGDVIAGQKVFLKNGLMEYGSSSATAPTSVPISPPTTCTANADVNRGFYLAPRDRPRRSPTREAAVTDLLRTNRYDAGDRRAALQRRRRPRLRASSSTPLRGLLRRPRPSRPAARGITDPATAATDRVLRLDGLGGRGDAARQGLLVHQQLAARAAGRQRADRRRPGRGACSRWPRCWAGSGLLFAAFGRYDFLGWHGRDEARAARSAARRGGAHAGPARLRLVLPGDGGALPAAGAARRARRNTIARSLASFFGLDLARLLPYNLARTWHVQLAIFWVATSFLAAGIFLAAARSPAASRAARPARLRAARRPRRGGVRQPVGEFARHHGWLGSAWAWLGNQGFEYLDLGRLWQVLLVVGLVLGWSILFPRPARRLRGEHLGNMPWLFFFAALAIPAFYAVGLLAQPRTHFTITDFWRFWVVHLWVEDFLELFTTIMVAYSSSCSASCARGSRCAVIYLDIILYSAGGVIGTMHHLYFSGEPAVHMALGAFFSAAEVIPLTFLTRRGLELPAARRAEQHANRDDRSRTAGR